jgi:hypothetical protein
MLCYEKVYFCLCATRRVLNHFFMILNLRGLQVQTWKAQDNSNSKTKRRWQIIDHHLHHQGVYLEILAEGPTRGRLSHGFQPTYPVCFKVNNSVLTDLKDNLYDVEHVQGPNKHLNKSGKPPINGVLFFPSYTLQRRRRIHLTNILTQTNQSYVQSWKFKISHQIHL